MTLMSYRSEDLSWNTATYAPAANVCGTVDSILFDLLLQTIGISTV
ncbi:hypothetical protein RIEGSTA812A_PEG_941 [invertebrate metagenome]|uniref:DNA translocase FtsK 4TM region domain-containing protein n=1 Tax=invertebrate metagenome TaxID=1711999 RepID=A0A484HBE4_9ZZZZ